MALKNAGCLSLRMGALLLLYIHLMGCIWGVMEILAAVSHPMYKSVPHENVPLYFMNLSVSMIGGLIFLTTIISIANKAPSNSLLITTTVISIFVVFHYIHPIVLFNTQYDVIVEENARSVSFHEQDEKAHVHKVVKEINLILICKIIFELYSALVFHSYRVEIEKTISGGVSPGKNYAAEANLLAPPAYTP